MKIFRNEKYLNTAKDEEFQFTETTPFNQPLIEVDDDLSNMASSTIYGKIIGILQVTNSICCVLCNKKVIPCPGNNGLPSENVKSATLHKSSLPVEYSGTYES